MSDSVRDLLVHGIAAAKDGDKQDARRYLEWVLRLDPTTEQSIKAWLWLSEVSDDSAEKREYLERILSVDPGHPEARRGLAILDGRLKPEEIIDPNRFVVTPPSVPQPTQAQPFVCPQCGGRMVFNPQGRLICEYCEQHQATPIPFVEEEIEERDLTLATAKGHTRPVATRCLTCRACGTTFLLSPETLSFTCPGCASAYVVEQAEMQELLPPAAIIPFAVSQSDAERAITRWLKSEHLEMGTQSVPLAGLYFPAWVFDVRCDLVEYTEPDKAPRPVHVEQKAIFEDTLLVPASRTLPELLADEVDHFRLNGLLPYDPRYLAGWPAETYQVSLADASLVARQKMLARVQRRFRLGGGNWEDVKTSTPSLAVESFKLILLPLWIARYRDGERQYTVIVNGQTGAVRSDRSSWGIRKWLSWLKMK